MEGCIYGWNQWVMDVCMNGCMDVWMEGCMYGWMDG